MAPRTRLHSTFVRLPAPLARHSPRAPGGFVVPACGPGGQDARVGGIGRGFQQRAAQAAICRGSKASRGEARRQPRLSRGASRSAQRGEARQVALGRRPCARATAPRGSTGIMASAARSTGGCSTSRMASAPSASCRPGARSASIIATRRDRCAGSCATSATPRSGCSATMSAACGRRCVYLNRIGVSPKVSAAGLLELLASLIGKPPRAARSRAQARRGCATRSQR